MGNAMTKLTPVVKATEQLIAGTATSARIKVAHALPDPNQPRKTFIQDLYDETKASIKAIGLQVPITVNPAYVKDGTQYYYIKYGENRWRIHVDLMWEEIECVIDPEPYDGKLNVLRVLTQAAENINRINHTHSEIAAVYGLFFEEEKRKVHWKKVGDILAEFAKIFGKSEQWVRNYAEMSNLRPEFLARVDIKGPTQIPFMAAVALGRQPKERQTGILHGAEVLAGSRRDMLYKYILQGAYKVKKAAGENVGHHIAANKSSFTKIPHNVRKAIDQFGVGMQPLDRDTHIRETMDEMSREELESMIKALDGVSDAIASLKNTVQVKLEKVSGPVVAPILFTPSKDDDEDVPSPESATPVNGDTARAPWPSFTTPREPETKIGRRIIKGGSY